MKLKKTWEQKLDSCRPHEVKPAPISIAGMKAGEIMLVPTARMVDDFIRAIPPNTSMDIKAVRAALARQHGAKVTCPITMGFHLRTVAEAAYEAHARGVPLAKVTPIWRVLDEYASTTKKLSFDPAFIVKQRAREGLDAK